jgi:hypothetical protein
MEGDVHCEDDCSISQVRSGVSPEGYAFDRGTAPTTGYSVYSSPLKSLMGTVYILFQNLRLLERLAAILIASQYDAEVVLHLEMTLGRK